MPDTAIDERKIPVRRETMPDEWRSFLDKLDRLFDGFDAGLDLPPSRRIFDLESFWDRGTALGDGVPAAEVSEDDKTYDHRRASRPRRENHRRVHVRRRSRRQGRKGAK